MNQKGKLKMDNFMKKEILDYLPIPSKIKIPKYIQEISNQESQNFNLKWYEITTGEDELKKTYEKFKNAEKSNFGENLYSEPRRFIPYLEDYQKLYYPRMALILNHLIKYTNFFNILKEWNESQIKILDIGAGPGNMSFAFIEYLEYINKLEIFDFKYEMNIVEQEKLFIDFIKKTYSRMKIDKPETYKKIDLNETIEPFRIDFDNIYLSLDPKLDKKKFHVIIIGFVLNENEPNRKKIFNLSAVLKEHLESNGLIIYLEAPSYHLYKYFNIDFEGDLSLYRNAPCLNGNRFYDASGKRNLPFWNPCGDLCVFQISDDERNKFCYLVLSKKEFLLSNYNDSIENSITIYKKYKHHLKLKKWEKQKEFGELFDVIGLFTNREKTTGYTSYYFCNGACKFKIDKLKSPELEIEEGNLVLLKNIIYDGVYQKLYSAHKRFFRKPYAEIGIKFKRNSNGKNLSDYEVIPYFFK